MKIRQLLHNYIYEQRWTLGFIEGSLELIVSGNQFEVKYIKGMPHDRWFADPFILEYDEKIIKVLVEEFSYKLRRGRIALVVIDRKTYNVVRYKILLDISTHLSFPFIVREDGNVFVYPENSESGSWYRYEYDYENELLIKPQVVVNEPLTDAILTNLICDKLIFSTQTPNQNGRELMVYEETGERRQKIVFTSNIARNAGDWFKIGEKVYRPAQDCNGGYGRAVILQEVLKNGNSFIFEDVRRIVSTNKEYTTGCHTFNNYKDLTVIDVHGWRRPKITKTILHLLNRF